LDFGGKPELLNRSPSMIYKEPMIAGYSQNWVVLFLTYLVLEV